MKIFKTFILGGSILLSQTALAHGPVPAPLIGAPIPPVPGLLDGPSPIVVDKNMAIALGKALFWDMNVGSDGQACGSCHFSAGADARVKNQINPGEKSSLPTGTTFDTLASGSGGPNHTLTLADFPLHQYIDPVAENGDGTSPISFTTDDVVASAGTFSGQFIGASQFNGMNDTCDRSADPIFHVGSTGTRRVEPRNTPTIINDIFNYRNFWDGRANNIFNGSSTWGDRDTSAGVWVKTNARTVIKQPLHLENSSLASLAMGPPLNASEMACRGRNLALIGRKLLMRKPLQNQKVHAEDSAFAPLNLPLSTLAEQKTGLNTTYKAMITKAFNPKYWSYSALGPFGAPAPGQMPYNQVEANFSLFFGIALQLYQSTLVSDQAPIDLSERDPISYKPTFQGLGKTPAEIASLVNGAQVFENSHCNICHAGPSLTTAAVTTNALLTTATPGQFYGPAHSPRAFGPNALGEAYASAVSGITPHGNLVTRDSTSGGPRLHDTGFANTSVGDPLADPGVAGVDDFGHPLSFSAQYVNYLTGNSTGIFDPGITRIKACDFIASLTFNSPTPNLSVFTIPNGIEPDGTREGVLRNQNCSKPTSWAYIPTVTAAAASLNPSSPAYAPKKLAVATQGAFKIPTLRNIELTGPYMHNGSMATLEQVLEFYGRHGNFNNLNKQGFVSAVSLFDGITTAQDRADLIAFLKSLTDDRVRYEKAPFDHPEIIVPNGHEGNDLSVNAGNPLSPVLAKDELLVVPAVGANGRATPLLPFDQQLAP
ncbi:MAG: cytochrome c peroxidase [Methylococcales bacterium]|nr:cytochrome C peroxidase [Methylococcaceae bacterium]